ncbi:MAG: PEGA domain-containing protein [Ignavibacteriales bacterium]
MIKQITFVILILLIAISCETNPPTSPENSTPQFGKAFITANVSDVEIWLDNTNTGQITPDTVETTVGTHTFTLKKADYLDASQIVEIKEDSLIILNIPLTEISETGRILISSNAEGAQIFIDQVNSGKVTPDTVLATPGVHQIELQRAFYNSLTQQVEVFKDSLISLDINLQEIPPSNVVLIEDFANVSCVPCVTSNKIIESLSNVTYGHSKLVAIKYPTNFPSPNDPFYLANTTDCNSRISYYNVFFAPTTVVDGIERPISTDSLSVMAAVDLRLTKPLQFRMDISTNLVGSQYFITITVKVLSGAGIDFSNTVLQTVVTETDIEFATPPGSNGETKFYDVMRTMLPSNAGQSLNGMSQTEEVVFQRQTTLNSSWVVNNLHVIAFIQNISSKEIYQTSSTFD